MPRTRSRTDTSGASKPTRRLGRRKPESRTRSDQSDRSGRSTARHGKLAVPEYILNKPGKLTPAEFEKMKLHATVGADILSAIDFPYPVVPIVRHHHENWDGTGYPSGLKGTEIPIGARILSVVDCFDALTSDRPYRPSSQTEEALKILMERRGVDVRPADRGHLSSGFTTDIAPERSASRSSKACAQRDRRFDAVASGLAALAAARRDRRQRRGNADTL